VPSQAYKAGAIVGHRYRLERLLGQGALGRVYLARDLIGRETAVAVKILASRTPTDSEIVALRQEFSLLTCLRHPNLVRILDFGAAQAGAEPFLVEEYIDGPELYAASETWRTEQIVRFIAGLARAVHYLHGRGIIHRDIKPSNILIPAGKTGPDNFKILDFGLAHWVHAKKKTNGVGTLAYTAPEILQGQGASVQSDLYSLGALCFQLLTRRLPFDDSDPGYLIQKQIQASVDLRPIEKLPLGVRLAQVLRSVLDKDPDKRPASGEELIRLLSVAAGCDYAREIPEYADNYFTTGGFVGRDREMMLVEDCANRVREAKRGWTLFITGESGAGKSRLMQEFRVKALLEGWRVFEAGCQRSDERSYGPFRETLSKTERIPVAGETPDKEIFRFEESPRPPETSGLELLTESAAGQFRDQLTREVVRRLCSTPTILMLHDFHWADEGTAAVLDYLSSDVQAHPILICVSVRSGEGAQAPVARIMDLVDRQGRGETLALDPLPEESVQQLITGMLGDSEVARAVFAWIYSSSGGNPFFVEEILKHLVDRGLLRREHGRWKLDQDRLSSIEVPASIAVVLRNRFEKLSPAAQEVARWLAIFRRPMPLELLEELAAPSREEISCSATELVDRQIVAYSRENGRDQCLFKHASIAEVIRNNTAAQERQEMHRRIATALESRADVDIVDVAYHLVEGRCGLRAVEAALQAAAQCKSEFAYEMALRFYKYVLKSNVLSAREMCESIIEASEVCCYLGLARKAVSMIRLFVKKASHETKPELFLQLAYAYQCLGRFDQATDSANRGLNWIRKAAGDSPHTRIVSAALLRQLAFCEMARSHTRNGLRLLRHALDVLADQDTPELKGHIFSTIATLCWVACDLREGVRAGEKAIEILESCQSSHLLGNAYSNLGSILTGLGRFRRARVFNELALQAGRRTRSLILQAQALANSVECAFRSGEFLAGSEMSKEMLKVAALTENRGIVNALTLVAVEGGLARGDYDSATRLLESIKDSVDQRTPVYTRAQRELWTAALAVESNDSVGALDALGRLEQCGSEEAPVYELDLAGILRARVCLQGGRLSEAVETLGAIETRAKRRRWPYQQCVVRLWQAEAQLRLANWQEARKASRDAIRLARALPSRHLEAYGRAALGEVSHECGEFDRAEAELKEALRLAEKLELLELVSRCCCELARLADKRADRHSCKAFCFQALKALADSETRMPAGRLEEFRTLDRRHGIRSVCDDLLRRHGERHEFEGLEEYQIRTLYRISNTINDISNTTELLEAAVDLLVEGIGMQRAFVFLRGAGEDLEFVSGRNLRKESLHVAETVSRTVLNSVNQEGKPFISANVASDRRLSYRTSVVNSDLGTLLCAPLRVRNRTIGTVYADHPAPMAYLAESTINVFAAFCNMIARAIDSENLGSTRPTASHIESSYGPTREIYPEIIGASPAIRRMLGVVARVSASPLDILIHGESGTGKELVARALHSSGRRKDARFVAVDCGSLAEGVVESELFGYRRGSFTGATDNRQGLLEYANGGIVFLDEISNMSLQLQGKLLRVLQEREVRRVGSNEVCKLDVQVIAATNAHLMEEVRKGSFRKDLYYRLCGVEVGVPPLRERRGDIELLGEHFLRRVAEVEGGRRKSLTAEALSFLSKYSYPGNVRELKSIVQAGYYLARGDVIGIDELPGHVRDERHCEVGGPEETRGRDLYERITSGKGTFASLLRRPLLRRRISAATARYVVHLALREAGGKYREALRELRVSDRDYAGTMVFLKRHDLFLDFRPYRSG
jgi:transcriptional regulator with GAF, ATPase, and Fis domain